MECQINWDCRDRPTDHLPACAGGGLPDTGADQESWFWGGDEEDGFSWDTLFDTVRTDDTLDVTLGELGDVGTDEFLAVDGGGNEFTGTYTQNGGFFFSRTFARVRMETVDDEIIAHIEGLIADATADNEDEVSEITVELKWVYTRATIFNDKMYLFWSAWFDLTVDEGDETGVEYNGFFKLGGSGEEASDDDGLGITG